MCASRARSPHRIASHAQTDARYHSNGPARSRACTLSNNVVMHTAAVNAPAAAAHAGRAAAAAPRAASPSPSAAPPPHATPPLASRQRPCHCSSRRAAPARWRCRCARAAAACPSGHWGQELNLWRSVRAGRRLGRRVCCQRSRAGACPQRLRSTQPLKVLVLGRAQLSALGAGGHLAPPASSAHRHALSANAHMLLTCVALCSSLSIHTRNPKCMVISCKWMTARTRCAPGVLHHGLGGRQPVAAVRPLGAAAAPEEVCNVLLAARLARRLGILLCELGCCRRQLCGVRGAIARGAGVQTEILERHAQVGGLRRCNLIWQLICWRGAPAWQVLTAARTF